MSWEIGSDELFRWGQPAPGAGNSYHPMLHPQARELLTDLKADEFLLHLLDCPKCRDVAIADLCDWKAGAAPNRIPPLIDPAARPEAEALFAELVPLASQQLEVFQDERFHDPVLLNLILEKGEEAARKKDFTAAADLAWLTVDLAGCIASEDVWVHACLSRAFFLAGSARRLDATAPPRISAAIHGYYLLKMARFRRLEAPALPWV